MQDTLFMELLCIQVSRLKGDTTTAMPGIPQLRVSQKLQEKDMEHLVAGTTSMTSV